MSESGLVATTGTHQLKDANCKVSIGKPIPNTIAKVVSIHNEEGKFVKTSIYVYEYHIKSTPFSVSIRTKIKPYKPRRICKDVNKIF